MANVATRVNTSCKNSRWQAGPQTQQRNKEQNGGCSLPVPNHKMVWSTAELCYHYAISMLRCVWRLALRYPEGRLRFDSRGTGLSTDEVQSLASHAVAEKHNQRPNAQWFCCSFVVQALHVGLSFFTYVVRSQQCNIIKV